MNLSTAALPKPHSLADAYVIVVAPDYFSRELLTLLLNGAGATVLTVTSIDEALAAMKRVTPSLIVCTLRKPKNDNFLFIKTIRSLPVRHGGQVPVIAIMDYIDANVRDTVLLAGYQKCLSISEVRALVPTAASLVT